MAKSQSVGNQQNAYTLLFAGRVKKAWFQYSIPKKDHGSIWQAAPLKPSSPK